MTFFSGEGLLDELFSKVFIGGFLFLVKLNEKLFGNRKEKV